MPRDDRTGPWGQGPGTGWGLGPCGLGRGRGYGGGVGRPTPAAASAGALGVSAPAVGAVPAGDRAPLVTPLPARLVPVTGPRPRMKPWP